MKEALQQDCDRYAPGVEIIAVRLTKPRIPDSITGNFEAMERERTKVTIAEERERVIIKEAEIERRRAVMQVIRKGHHFSYLAGSDMATGGGHSVQAARNGGMTLEIICMRTECLWSAGGGVAAGREGGRDQQDFHGPASGREGG